MEYSISYIWDKGSRPVNQDSLHYIHMSVSGHSFIMAVVADGIGSFTYSEEASGYLVRELARTFRIMLRRHPDSGMNYYMRGLKRCLYRTHRTLSEYGRYNNTPIATTCSLVFIKDRKAFLLHLGDGRILYNNRLLTPSHCDRHGHLTAAIGIAEYQRAYIRRLRFRRNSHILLCTDGYYKHGSKDNKSSILITVSI
ncbi:MAG: protein phosphatase 2C domain-containing protein [Lachnospiraceae bacterium]|nr:protein phosphatase 2C domain-containing protein [Lachnospiraceae bacterium]